MGNWIKGAINPAHKGDFRRKAQAAGMSTAAYASKALAKGSMVSTRTKRQAALAKTLSGLRKR